MEIEKVIGSGGRELEDFVLSAPNSLLYANPSYLDLITSHLNATPSWLVARIGEAITGALSFAHKDGDFGPVYNSLPFYGSNGGVVQANSDDQVKKTMNKGVLRLCSKGERLLCNDHYQSTPQGSRGL